MAIFYVIMGETNVYPTGLEIRKRRDSAKQAFLAMVYEHIKGTAGLDTQRGVDAMDKAQAIDLRLAENEDSKIWSVRIRPDAEVKVMARREVEQAQ